MKAHFANSILILIAFTLFAGCAPTGHPKNIRPQPTPLPAIYGTGSQVGIISGSIQGHTTAMGYQAFSSVGEPTSKITETTALGYQVFSSVQSNIVSE